VCRRSLLLDRGGIVLPAIVAPLSPTGWPVILAQVPDALDPDRVSEVLRQMVSPALTILLILVVAEIVSLIAKRFVRKAVDRAKEPPSGRRDDLRRRVGLAEGDPVNTERRAQRADAVGALAEAASSRS
jgi:hypothetical protein